MESRFVLYTTPCFYCLGRCLLYSLGLKVRLIGKHWLVLIDSKHLVSWSLSVSFPHSVEFGEFEEPPKATLLIQPNSQHHILVISFCEGQEYFNCFLFVIAWYFLCRDVFVRSCCRPLGNRNLLPVFISIIGSKCIELMCITSVQILNIGDTFNLQKKNQGSYCSDSWRFAGSHFIDMRQLKTLVLLQLVFAKFLLSWLNGNFRQDLFLILITTLNSGLKEPSIQNIHIVQNQTDVMNLWH